MDLRRGFKSEAEWYAKEFRSDLSLTEKCPLDPQNLAESLSIPLLRMTDLQDEVPEAVKHFSNGNQTAFSGLTVFKGSQRLIVYNDTVSRGRINNSIAHELSHGILGHPPMPPMCSNGLRTVKKDLEDEADHLAATLLIPKPVALHILFEGMSHSEAAINFGVSEELLRWRLNMSGAMRIFSNSRRKHHNHRDNV